MGKKQKALTPDEKLQIEMERERQARALESYLKTGHGMPKTRREFLASGVMAGAGFIAAPSIFELILRENAAHAQESAECAVAASDTDLVPFIQVNLSGGASLMANFVPHDANRQPLQSYSTLGLGTPANFNIVRDFGNTPFPARADGSLITGFLTGLREQADQTVRDKTAFVGVCVRSQDDTSANKFSIAGLVQAAGLKGSDLPNLGTNAGQGTGVNQQPAFVRPPAPLRVANFNDVNGALAASGILAQQLTTQPQRAALMGLVKNLSASQQTRLMASSSGATLGKLVECATDKNLALATATSNGIDPRQVANIAPIWGITPQTGNGDQNVVRASIVFNALNGKAGAGGIDLGGYDYHGNARATTDDRDRQAGVLVGRILSTANALQRPIFIYVTSDGACNAANSTTPGANFTGDSGSRGMAFMIAYNPTARPATNDFQLGNYTNAQSADDAFLPNWNAERASLAVFANWLQLGGKISLLNQVQGGQFDAAQLVKVLKFA